MDDDTTNNSTQPPPRRRPGGPDLSLWREGRPTDGVPWAPATAGLLLAGLIAAAIGLYLGLAGVGECGSPWRPDTSAVERQQDVDALTHAMEGLPGEEQEDPAAYCDHRFGSRGTLGTGLLVLGGIGLGAGVVLRSREMKDAAARKPDADTP